MDTARHAAELLAPLFDGLREEAVAVLHLDGERRVLAVMQFDGKAGSAELPFRAIVEEAFRLGSAALVLAHNHPGGMLAPSEDDLAATRRLAQVVEPLGIRLHDHLIFAREGCLSLRGLGLL
ncbi:MAG: JAB domain-containing protein [Allosphingosinicella sp.]|uniref:JAB domain-containing protein n=1 Tax=Allosphingosinicella sp. TaxID=2823234 RepID=UPI0039453E06